MIVTITRSGKINIPTTICHQLDIKAGTRIRIDLDKIENRIILRPLNRAYIHHLRGKYKGTGLLKALIEDRRREATRI